MYKFFKHQGQLCPIKIKKKSNKFLKIMKISILLLFIGIFTISATGYSQEAKISIQLHNNTVDEVFTAIKEQTDYSFWFDVKDVDVTQQVSLSVENETVKSVLSQALKDQDVDFTLYGNHIIIAKKGTFDIVGSQQIIITGNVTDNTGEPLPGVNIVIKGVNSGVMTSVDGSFTITVPNNDAILVFSYIGFQTIEMPVGNQRTLNIKLLENTRELEEVVVVGYGTQKKVNLTGAVEQIDSKQLKNRSVPSISHALNGKVAGLNIAISNGAPGSTPSINLRGYTGLGVKGAPLVVIDGVQGGNLNNIEMNDVESISFLKDAASAAIYGSSAPYGVIIVNMKRGRAGKPLITYNNNFGFSHPTNLPKPVNALDFVNFVNEVCDNSNSARMVTEEQILRIKDYMANGGPNVALPNPAADGWLSSRTQGHMNNDWYDIYFKKSGFSQQHSVGVSGSSETSNYYAGLGYTQEDGLLNFANDVFRRYNARVNLSVNLTKWLTFGLRGAYYRRNTNTPETSFATNDYSFDILNMIGAIWPTVPLRFENGQYTNTSQILNLSEGGRKKETTDNAILTGEFIFRPLPGWNITANYTFSGTYAQSDTHKKTFYYELPSGTQVAVNTPNNFNRNMSKTFLNTINAFSSYEKSFNRHYFKVLAGFTQQLNDYMNMYGSNTNLYSDELPMISMTYGSNLYATDGASQLATRGVFGRINYNFNEKYLLELNGRYDGTSRFLKDKRFKFYPGVSGAWVPSKESFWEPVRQYVNLLKLRASYASLGDNAFTSGYYPFYPSLGYYSPASSRWVLSSGAESAFSNPGFVNNDLTWITVNTLGIGVDIAALNNRLEFSFDWYNRYAKDFAGAGEVLPAILGTTAPQTNNTEMETRGFEITAGWRDQIDKFSYGVTLVLSDYKGKVVKYNNPTKLISSMWYKGMNMGEIWGYETVGLFQNQAEIDAAANQSYLDPNWYPGDIHLKDLNEDGKIDIGKNTLDDPGDRKVIGNNTPRYSFGVTLNADWKGFDASVFMQGVGKRDVMFSNEDQQFSNFFWSTGWNYAQIAYFKVHTDRWTEDNPNGYFPRNYLNTQKNKQNQTRYLQNGAYLRVKNIQLGYTLPKEITNKINFQQARIFINVENLATFTKLIKIVDPEIVAQYARTYPVRCTWSFGANVTF